MTPHGAAKRRVFSKERAFKSHNASLMVVSSMSGVASASHVPVSSEDLFSAFRKKNQYATAVLEKAALQYEMKTSLQTVMLSV